MFTLAEKKKIAKLMQGRLKGFKVTLENKVNLVASNFSPIEHSETNVYLRIEREELTMVLQIPESPYRINKHAYLDNSAWRVVQSWNRRNK